MSLLQVGGREMARFGYETRYGPLIIFTGVSAVFGGWGLLWRWKWKKLLYLV